MATAQLADDIAQESLIKAYLSCEGFREEAKFSSWIFRIAYNTFLNHRRDERRTVGYDEAPDTPGDDTADSSSRYQELYAALNGLPPKEERPCCSTISKAIRSGKYRRLSRLRKQLSNSSSHADATI